MTTGRLTRLRPPPPERRTRRDLGAAAAITVVVALVLGAAWLGSDARATDSSTAASPAAPLAPTPSLPSSLAAAWSAPSGATTRPVVESGSAVTADGATVTGRDPVTGDETWRYARDVPLCAVAGQWGLAVAVYRVSRGCSQVTALQAADCARGPQRSSDADPSVSLVTDGTYLTAVGDTRLEVWRSDLVRTTEVGRVDAPVNPGTQPRTGCTLGSTGTTTGRLAVVERCPGDDSDRLSLYASAPTDAERPEEFGSVLLGVDGARVVAVTGTAEAVLLPGDTPTLVTYDSRGAETSRVPLPASVLGPAPVTPTEATTRSGATISRWAGGATVGLDPVTLTPQWLLPAALGPGDVVGGQLLVPVADGIAEVDPTTGVVARTAAVDRAGWDPATGPITSRAAGDTWLEQRGGTVVGLRAP